MYVVPAKAGVYARSRNSGRSGSIPPATENVSGYGSRLKAGTTWEWAALNQTPH